MHTRPVRSAPELCSCLEDLFRRNVDQFSKASIKDYEIEIEGVLGYKREKACHAWINWRSYRVGEIYGKAT